MFDKPGNCSRIDSRCLFEAIATAYESVSKVELLSPRAALITLGAIGALSAPASAQEVGTGLCGTPLADTINQAAPLIIGILMICGAILSYVLHNASAFVKDPQALQAVKNWRNRAAFTSITTPLFAIVMEIFIGFTGVGLAECVQIVPFL